MITLCDYLMGRDKSHAAEYSETISIAAEELLDRVNLLLAELEVETLVCSGWRPPSVNAQVKGAAKHSKHMTGHAIDIADPTRKIARAIVRDPEILVRSDLYAEDPEHTRGYIHLQSVGPGSGKRIFKP